MMTGTDIVHVPYKGSAPAVTDLLGGHVRSMFDNTPNVLPHVKAGKLRALAMTSRTRSAHAPDIPTVAEAGVPGYEVDVWFGLVAPAGTPREVLAKLNAEINRILADARRASRSSPTRASSRSAARRSNSASTSRPRSRSGAKS